MPPMAPKLWQSRMITGAVVGHTEFRQESWENILVQPRACLPIEIGSFWNGEERSRASVARPVDGDERYPEGITCDRCCVARTGIEIVAIVSSSVKCHIQWTIADGDPLGRLCIPVTVAPLASVNLKACMVEPFTTEI